MTTQLVRISTEYHQLLGVYAKARSISLKEAIEEAVAELLDKDEELRTLLVQVVDKSKK